MAAFRAELKKAHRRHDLAFCLLLPLILVLWVGGLAPASEDELSNAYSALFYSIPVLEAILLPVMMAVLASRLWDLEVKGNTLKLLYTLQSRRSLFAGKAVFGVLEVLVTVAVELACIPVLGMVHGYTEAFPKAQFVYLFVCTLAVDLIVGSLVGLFSAFMPPLVSYFVPWGYYIPLGSYVVAYWDPTARTVTYGTRPCSWGLLAFTILLGIGLFYAAWRRVQTEEV